MNEVNRKYAKEQEGSNLSCFEGDESCVEDEYESTLLSMAKQASQQPVKLTKKQEKALESNRLTSIEATCGVEGIVTKATSVPAFRTPTSSDSNSTDTSSSVEIVKPVSEQKKAHESRRQQAVLDDIQFMSFISNTVNNSKKAELEEKRLDLERKKHKSELKKIKLMEREQKARIEEAKTQQEFNNNLLMTLTNLVSIVSKANAPSSCSSNDK